MQITLEANHTQRFQIARMFQQLLKQDPMVSKIGGYASQLLLEAVRFHFQHLPLVVNKVVKELEVAGDDEPERKTYYEFSFEWHHPCIDYKVKITKEIPVEDFENII